MTMAEIGVRELKEKTSEIIRRVREEKETFDITYRGRVVAWLVPIARPEKEEDWRTIWAEMDKTAEEIGKKWPKGLSAVEAVREQRR
jgi:prevent-host-death family protein